MWHRFTQRKWRILRIHQLELLAAQRSLQGRRELLEQACLSHTRKRQVLSPEDLKHLIVDDKHSLIYCYVPKAHVAGNLRTLSEFSVPEINRRLRSYLKFIFVRDPFERLYLVDPRTQREEPFNEHWERVHSLCHPCLIHYDVVGKYETLEPDAQAVLSLAGVEGSLQFPTSGKSTRTDGNMAARYFKHISPFYQKKLFNLYRMDFLLFNYSTPDREGCRLSEEEGLSSTATPAATPPSECSELLVLSRWPTHSFSTMSSPFLLGDNER
ncbi:hypothetical protein F7725_000295 [Dissostichus mawsoni]|uniref:Carbohydrate sulfotransferase n=1 Tax=Dissostichus mawsoni TaxID=36200 RepID=A0A7J5ZEK3_DISMA|nr:hypothetical protein F7725_000295 [Dissostichus mawsoni]